MTEPLKKIEIFTDGACRGNPGPGGWGVVLRYNGKDKYLHGAVEETTNNRMELTAAIEAIAAVKYTCEIDLTTDSQYVRKGITEWVENWEKRGWKTSSKKPVKNVDLWKQLLELIRIHEIRWHWVKGHSGHEGNEKADDLANSAIDKLLESK